MAFDQRCTRRKHLQRRRRPVGFSCWQHLIVQLSRHERILRSEGQLAFLDGTVVRHNGREIEKMSAVTMLDHGSLQDRVFMHVTHRALFGAQLTTKTF